MGVLVIVAGKLGGSDRDPEALWAVGAVFLSAICYAYNLILARRQAKMAGPMEIAFYQNLFVALFLALAAPWFAVLPGARSEEHTSELQSLMRISYAVFCLKQNN